MRPPLEGSHGAGDPKFPLFEENHHIVVKVIGQLLAMPNKDNTV